MTSCHNGFYFHNKTTSNFIREMGKYIKSKVVKGPKYVEGRKRKINSSKDRKKIENEPIIEQSKKSQKSVDKPAFVYQDSNMAT